MVSSCRNFLLGSAYTKIQSRLASRLVARWIWSINIFILAVDNYSVNVWMRVSAWFRSWRSVEWGRDTSSCCGGPANTAAGNSMPILPCMSAPIFLYIYLLFAMTCCARTNLCNCDISFHTFLILNSRIVLNVVE